MVAVGIAVGIWVAVGSGVAVGECFCCLGHADHDGLGNLCKYHIRILGRFRICSTGTGTQCDDQDAQREEPEMLFFC